MKEPNNQNNKITREGIVKIGDSILILDNVENVVIRISFKDGSDISYNKSRFELRSRK